jgi:nucleotide-binding universal stress UspA family protein
VFDVGDLPLDVADRDADEFAYRGERAAVEAADRAAEAGLDATGAVLDEGRPVSRTILDYADAHGVDCIVMGTHGQTGLGRLVLGSATERTLRASSIPILTVHEDTVVDASFDTIVVPTDGGACARAAAEHAIDLARWTDATLRVVSVVDPGARWFGGPDETELDTREAAGERAIERVVDRAADAGVETVDQAIRYGRPGREIAVYADEQGASCVVTGTHGRSGVARYRLGSVTERVVRLATPPVLSVTEPPTG